MSSPINFENQEEIKFSLRLSKYMAADKLQMSSASNLVGEPPHTYRSEQNKQAKSRHE